MGKRERLDLLLLERRLVDSREEGRRKILAGDVLVNDQAVTKAGSLDRCRRGNPSQAYFAIRQPRRLQA